MSSSTFRQMTPGISSDRSSSEYASFLQLSTKVARVADSWTASKSSSSESSSSITEEIDFSGDGIDSEDKPANEKTTVNMDQDVRRSHLLVQGPQPHHCPGSSDTSHG